jgi:hypothetical protein
VVYLQFTKEGSIFVCVQIVSKNQSHSFPTETGATTATTSVSSGPDGLDGLLTKEVKKRRRFSWSSHQKTSVDQPIESLQTSVVTLVSEEDPKIKPWQQWKDGICGQSDNDDASSPNLSMQFGTKESVDKWRNRPEFQETIDSKSESKFTVAISIEDTGTCFCQKCKIVVANVSISRDGKKNHDCYWLTFPK